MHPLTKYWTITAAWEQNTSRSVYTAGPGDREFKNKKLIRYSLPITRKSGNNESDLRHTYRNIGKVNFSLPLPFPATF